MKEQRYLAKRRLNSKNVARAHTPVDRARRLGNGSRSVYAGQTCVHSRVQRFSIGLCVICLVAPFLPLPLVS
jgi:hypothetical protein